MSTSNRVQITTVRESTPGTTPTTPRMRLARLTGESLSFTPNYINSDEIRSDRMLAAPVKVMQASEGGINFELSYPDDDSPLSDLLRSAFFNTWVNTPTFFNDGTADSIITDAGTTANTYVVASGGAAVKTRPSRARDRVHQRGEQPDLPRRLLERHDDCRDLLEPGRRNGAAGHRKTKGRRLPGRRG
jgi:hypothetical protein